MITETTPYYHINNDHEQKQQQSLILTQLSKLVHLERWKLPRPYGRLDKTLQLTMETGLCTLKTLERLKSFQGPSSAEFEWKEPEARWMIEHWPRMEKLN